MDSRAANKPGTPTTTLKKARKKGTGNPWLARRRAEGMCQWGIPQLCSEEVVSPLLCSEGRVRQAVRVAGKQTVATAAPGKWP